MNIYFACSITGGREFQPVFAAITRTLLENGHTVPTARIADPDAREREGRKTALEIYRRDIEFLRRCDLLIAEVSTPSHGVGYEIAYALGLGKPVFCLHQRERSVSKMITGNPDKRLRVESYENERDAVRLVREFLNLPSVGL